MYRTHIQCVDIERAAWPKPASLSARGLNSGLGESTTGTVSLAAASAGQDAVRGDRMGVLPEVGLQGRSGVHLKSSGPTFSENHALSTRAHSDRRNHSEECSFARPENHLAGLPPR